MKTKTGLTKQQLLEMWKAQPKEVRDGYMAERIPILKKDKYPLVTYKKWFPKLVGFHESQLEASRAVQTHKFVLYGGSRGPGKSYWLRWELVRFLLDHAYKGKKGLVVGLFCEDYPSLKDRQVGKIDEEFPHWLGTIYKSPRNEFVLHEKYGGGKIIFRNLDKPEKYQSVEFAAQAVDEITKNPEKIFQILNSSLRWPQMSGTDLKFICASNPAANWVRDYWRSAKFPENMEVLKEQFKFVAALPDSNPHLDESYWHYLDTLDEALKQAWRYGNWFASVEGLVYSDFTDENIVRDDEKLGRDKFNHEKGNLELAIDDGYIDARATLFIQKLDTHILILDELYQHKTLPETTIKDIKEKCKDNDWPLPIIAAVSHEAVTLRERLKLAGIPARNWMASKKGVTSGSVRLEAINKTRGLIKDGNGYRAILIHERCENLLNEIRSAYKYKEGKRGLHEKPADGNDHAAQAMESWMWLRIRRNTFSNV